MKRNLNSKPQYFPKISIVIVNWNGRKYIRKCLESVLKSSYPKDRLEVIVVDNGSIDGSAEIIMNEFPGVILLRNRQNLGFCEANNIGIRHCTGDVVILLNNDAFVDPNWLVEIVEAMKDPEVGIVGCKLLYPNGKIIQACGYKEVFPYYWDSIAAGLENEKFEYVDRFEVDYVPGAALAVKMEVLRKIGLLDPTYNSFVEDLDLCYRAVKNSYKVIVAPKAIVYHYGSASWKLFPIQKMYLMYKNKIIFICKHKSRRELLKYIVRFLPLFTRYSLIKYLKKCTVIQRVSKKQKFSRDVNLYSKKLIILYFLNLFFFFITIIPAIITCMFKKSMKKIYIIA
jgi:GT2 family glycosyltransferase